MDQDPGRSPVDEQEHQKIHIPEETTAAHSRVGFTSGGGETVTAVKLNQHCPRVLEIEITSGLIWSRLSMHSTPDTRFGWIMATTER